MKTGEFGVMTSDSVSVLKNDPNRRIRDVVVRRRDETIAGYLRRVREEFVARTPQADRTKETLR